MQKKPLVPDYLYSSRVEEGDIPYFENLFYENVELYPEEVRENELKFEFAKRMGYHWTNKLSDRVSPTSTVRTTLMGDEGFQWSVDLDLLTAVESPVAICAGAGTNISFEQELARLVPNAIIALMDPSPQAIGHVQRQTLEPNIEFLPKGLGGKDETLRFFKPSVKGIGSLSALQLNPGDQYFDLPVLKVASVLDRMGRSGEEIDYLKFDIEGSEHAVIENLIDESILPKQISFEFDQPVPPWTMAESLRKLLRADYELARVWGLNVHLIRCDLL